MALRNFMTAVLERDGITAPDYVTEPYEAGWALQARWFVRTLSLPAGVERIDLAEQISPDGLHWCDLEGEVDGANSASIDSPGVVSWACRDFGGWLRLRARVVGSLALREAPFVPAVIYLALKG